MLGNIRFIKELFLANLLFVASEEIIEMLGTILLVILVIVLLGALPTWPYSSGWGYYPSGGIGIVVIILLVLLMAGRI